MGTIYTKLHVRWKNGDGSIAKEDTIRVAMPIDLVANIPHDVFGDAYDETRARVAEKVRDDPMHLSHVALVEDMPDEDIIGYPLLVPARRPMAQTT